MTVALREKEISGGKKVSFLSGYIP